MHADFCITSVVIMDFISVVLEGIAFRQEASVFGMVSVFKHSKHEIDFVDHGVKVVLLLRASGEKFNNGKRDKEI